MPLPCSFDLVLTPAAKLPVVQCYFAFFFFFTVYILKNKRFYILCNTVIFFFLELK